jgi:hypothetical protein
MESRKPVKRTAAGKAIEREPAPARPGNSVDLKEALRRSVKRRGKAAGTRKQAARRPRSADARRAKRPKKRKLRRAA